MAIKIKKGKRAIEQLTAHAFRESWQKIYEQCPWAAPALSFDYVSIWYEVYRQRFSPILVSKEGPNGELLGVLPLAEQKDDGSLTVAGGNQGEYKVWLAPPNDGGEFITKALLLVRQTYPGRTLTFMYLPPMTPLDFLSKDMVLKTFCKVRSYSRPLLILNEAALKQSLRKKSNKSRINRLRALGEINFVRLTRRAEAEPLMEEIATQCDLRQGAAHDSLPFSRDPVKRIFYRLFA